MYADAIAVWLSLEIKGLAPVPSYFAGAIFPTLFLLPQPRAANFCFSRALQQSVSQQSVLQESVSLK